MTAQVSISAQTIRSTRLGHETLPYEFKIQEKIAQVQAMVAFVEQEHFSLATVYAYLQQDKRSVLAVRNIARILGYPLDEQIGETYSLLRESEGSDLAHFTDSFAPALFVAIDSVGPNREFVSDLRTHVEELQYATETRQALLQYLLISYNARYQRANLFGNLLEASKWTAMYSQNLDTADQIIHHTRDLLVAQKNAVRDYLNFITQEIREIYDLAEARYRVVKPIAYMQAIEAAENRIVHVLGERSQAYETLNLAALTPQQRRSRFSGLAKHVIGRAPKLAIFLMGLAAAGGGLFAFMRPQSAAAQTAAPSVPQPVRSTADSSDTARFTTINTGNLGVRSAQMLQDIAATLTGSQSQTNLAAATSPVIAVEAQKIGDFFATVRPTSGKQTLVLESAAELRAFVDFLQTQKYYTEGELLSLFNLASANDFSHSLVVDVRHNALKPMLFPYNEANSHLTAPMSAIPGTNAIGSGLVSLVTAAFSDVNSNTAPMAALQPGEAFIVYRVQSGDSIEAIAARYGTTSDQIQADNHLSVSTVAKGQTLQIRRPAATDTKTAPFSLGFWGNGATKVLAAPTAVAKATLSNEVVGRYYTQLFPTLNDMPSDAREYVVTTVDEVASFFNVQPQDVLGILKQEQNNAGFRLYEDRVSSAGAVGVAQIVPQTWNGWQGSNATNFTPNMAEIERDGGIGFDWAARETWRQVQSGTVPLSALENTDADPTVFENAIAGVARHLSGYGVTAQLAQQDPAQYEAKLKDAIAIYNSGRPLSESNEWVQSAQNQSTTGTYVAQALNASSEVAGAFQQIATTAVTGSVTPTAALEQRYSTRFRELFDQDFGIQLSDAELTGFLAANQTLLDDVRLGKIDPMVAGTHLIEQVELHYTQEGREALKNGDIRPWPYIHNVDTLEGQRLAVSLLGRTLTLNEMDLLVVSTNAEPTAMRSALAGRADSKIFVQAQQAFDQLLQRSARGLNSYNYEIAGVVQPLMSGVNAATLDDTTLRSVTGQIQAAIRAMPEYQGLFGTREFKAMPMLPMPEVFKGFGVPVSYQAGGYHTGIDVAASSENGQAPPVFAVDNGTVVHVGSIYCAQPDACRGGKAVVIDHGNEVYSLYSHNSEASVQVGQQVEAGQQIGRQGSEGFSYGPHLHFEVHIGAPWSGDWEKPFEGGSFVDPLEFLPKQ